MGAMDRRDGQVDLAVEAKFCFQLHVGRLGLSTSWNFELPSVQLEFRQDGVSIPAASRRLMGIPIFSNSWRAQYREIEVAEAVVIPRWISLRDLDREKAAFGIRLVMADPLRSRVLLFTDEVEEVVASFKSHHVRVDEVPRRLNRFLIGFR